MLTPEKYEALKAKLLDAGPDDYSLEAQERAFAAIDEYEAAEQAKEQADTEQAQALMQQLDPSMPIVPQVLATQGGTNHPGGDQEAESEWLSGPLDNPAGRVIVYDAPADITRQRLMENPQLQRTLFGRELTPEDIASIQAGDSMHQAYNDLEWESVAKQARAGGKTAYRHNRAPWLDGGPNASWLDTLSTKLKASALPAMETASAFIMGVDNSANFGAATAAANAGAFDGDSPAPLTPEEEASGQWEMHPTLGKMPKGSVKRGAVGTPIGGGGDEVVGGVFQTAAPGASARETNDRLVAESPIAHAAGEVGGAFTGASSKLFDMTLGAASKTIAKEGSGLGRRALAGALGMGTAGAAEQAIGEGVDAAAGGDATLGEAAGRVAEGGADALMFGGPFAAIQGLAKAGGKWVREGKRYKGLPGQAEKLNGGKVEVGRGHIDPPDVQAARAEGKSRKMEVGPVDVLAEKLDEPIRQAGSELVGKVEKAGAANAAAHYASDEGKAPLRAKNVMKASLDRLRAVTGDVGDKKVPVGKSSGASAVLDIFNTNIEAVSAKPSKGSIPLSRQEAESYLSKEWQEKLGLGKPESKKGVWTSDKTEPVVDTVYITPRRYSSESLDDVIRQFGKSSDENVKALREAALADRERRTWNGVKGGWSKVQEEQAKGVAKAKDLQERAGGDKPGGAYKAVVQASTPHKGESRKLSAISELAKRSDAARPKPYGPQSTGPGPTEKLFDSARAAGVMDELRGWSSLGKNPSGLDRGRTAAAFDAATLRLGYPIARKVEKAGDARKMGKAGAVNNDDAEREERAEKREAPAKQAAKERAAEAEREPKKGKRRKRPSWEWMREEMN